MQIIRTSEEGKQLEAALCVASQVGYVIPEYFTQVLESCTDAAATELVEKLVDTLSNREPSLEYPRIRRVLVEVVISIVDLSPGYIEIFRPSLGGGGTYPREGKPRRGFLCPLNFLGAIPEGARKSLALFGILGVEARRTKIAS